MHPLGPDFKTTFGFSTADNAALDSKIDLMLNMAEQRILHQFSVVCSETDYTVNLPGKNSSNLYTKLTPISSVSSITDSAGVAVDITMAYIEGNKIVVPGYTFTLGVTYTVMATYGYYSTDLPHDLKYAILKLAWTAYNDSKFDTGANKSASNALGDRVTQSEIDIPKGVAAILKSYRGLIL